jgi:hypothetical protein
MSAWNSTHAEKTCIINATPEKVRQTLFAWSSQPQELKKSPFVTGIQVKRASDGVVVSGDDVQEGDTVTVQSLVKGGAEATVFVRSPCRKGQKKVSVLIDLAGQHAQQIWIQRWSVRSVCPSLVRVPSSSRGLEQDAVQAL